MNTGWIVVIQDWTAVNTRLNSSVKYPFRDLKWSVSIFLMPVVMTKILHHLCKKYEGIKSDKCRTLLNRFPTYFPIIYFIQCSYKINALLCFYNKLGEKFSSSSVYIISKICTSSKSIFYWRMWTLSYRQKSGMWCKTLATVRGPLSVTCQEQICIYWFFCPALYFYSSCMQSARKCTVW